MIPLLAALPMPNPPPPSGEQAVASDAASLFIVELPPEEDMAGEDAAAGEPPGLPSPLTCQTPVLLLGVPGESPEVASELECPAPPVAVFALSPGVISLSASDCSTPAVVPATEAPANQAPATEAPATVEEANPGNCPPAPEPTRAAAPAQAGHVPPAAQGMGSAGVVMLATAEQTTTPAPVRISGAQSAFEVRAGRADAPSPPDAVAQRDDNREIEVQAERMPAATDLDSPTPDSQSIEVLSPPVSGTGPSARPVAGQVHAAVVALAHTPAREAAPDAASLATVPDRGVELRLDPEELGRVSISLRSEGDALMVRVVAERPETLDLLRRNADQLLQDLRNSGFRDAQMAFGSSGEGAQGGQHPAADPGSPLAGEEAPAQPPRGAGFVGARPLSRDGALNIRL